MVSSFPFSRSFSGPFSRPLSRPSAVNIDPDAGAYIDAIVAAGATVSDTQRTAIGDFYVAAKADGYYTSLKRLYLPIWGVAAANAIDMIGLTSGTFNGSVTHGAGYVQGDGSTGYFDMVAKPVTLGVTVQSGSCFVMYYTVGPVSKRPIGCGTGTADFSMILSSTSSGRVGGAGIQASLSSDRKGVWITNRVSQTNLRLHKRGATGMVAGTINATDVSAGSLPDLNIFGIGFNNNGTVGSASNAQISAFGVGLGINDVSVFTLAIKNLWETTTGLILP